MNRAHLAVAALGVVAGSAAAQSNVTLYGLVDASLRHDSHYNAAGGRTALVSGMANTSRWGIRASEDLGQGRTAYIVLESGLNPDTGMQTEAASLFDRRAGVGLTGGWGRVEIGRGGTFGWDYTPVYDPLGGALATPTSASHSTGKAALLVNGFLFLTNNPYTGTKLRDNNIKYTYAGQNGWFAGLDYSLGEVAGDRSKRAGWQGVLGYAKDAVSVVAAFDELRDAADLKQRVLLAGGNYTFASHWKATLGYAVQDADAGFAPSSAAVTGAIANYSSVFGVHPGGKIRIAVTGEGLSYPVLPAMTLTGAVYGTRISGDGIPANDYHSYVLMAKYALSKRTLLYSALDRQTATVNGGLGTVSGGRGNHGVTLGMQTRF